MSTVHPSGFVPILTVMADYGNAPFLWLVDSPDQGGVGPNICDATCWNEHDPLSESLWREFAEWAIEFDRTEFYSDEFEGSDWDWIAFHTRGLKLAHRLKAEVGEAFRVVYAKPREDPSYHLDGRREILSGGRVVALPSFRPAAARLSGGSTPL